MDENLTRRERRKFFKEEQKETVVQKTSSKKFLTYGIILAIIFLIGFWIYKSVTTPLPGTATKDLGREHLTDISGITYDTNPPSSGNHFPLWAKRGFYDRVLSDGYLIHSQEHGYVVISYNCDAPKTTNLPESFFKMNFPIPTDPTKMTGFTPQNPPEKEVELPEAFNSEACKSLVINLKKYLDTAQRVVIVPKINLDTQISLNAWDRIDKFNLASVSSVSKDEDERITKFIKAFHNKGPEKTTE